MLVRLTCSLCEIFLGENTIFIKNMIWRFLIFYFSFKIFFKGSTVQRQASEKEKSKQLPTLKDNDFLEENYKLMLPGDAKSQLMKLLKSDTGILNICDILNFD